MSDETKSPEIERFTDEIAIALFGRSFSLAKAGNGCVACGKPATTFRDALSKREYGISGLCQSCQDSIFG